MKHARTQRFETNARGRDFIVGDVHGHFPTLEELLAEVGYDASADRLFSVGDLVNRGPESERALEWINNRFAGVTAGNHERWMQRHFQRAGTNAALGPDEQWAKKIPSEEYEKWGRVLNELPIAITVETEYGPIGIVHADAPTKHWNNALALFEESTAWDNIALLGFDEGRETRATRRATPMEGVRALVHGHMPTQYVDHAGNRWGIDTGAGNAGLERLTMMEINHPSLKTFARGTG